MCCFCDSVSYCLDLLLLAIDTSHRNKTLIQNTQTLNVSASTKLRYSCMALPGKSLHQRDFIWPWVFTLRKQTKILERFFTGATPWVSNNPQLRKALKLNKNSAGGKGGSKIFAELWKAWTWWRYFGYKTEKERRQNETDIVRNRESRIGQSYCLSFFVFFFQNKGLELGWGELVKLVAKQMLWI